MNLRKAYFKVFNLLLTLIILKTAIYSQIPPKPQEDDFTWWWVSLFVLTAALVAAIIWWYKQKAATKALKEVQDSKTEKNLDGHTFDADEEMEWLRKNQNIVDRKRRKSPGSKTASGNMPAINLPKTTSVFDNTDKALEANAAVINFSDLESLPLPVFDFFAIVPAKAYTQLPLSNDNAILSAIEQTQDEDEEDEEVRELAVRILAAFQTRNSVEALTQVALYDLSSSLRSKAVTVLTEFDHETVFETILLACADPTREVRAAAARGLTRFSFDRADAWARILEGSQEGRMRHAVRAAIEGGFVERSFDRLIHRDTKYAYEAFVLLALVIKAGEYDQIIEALKNHRDIKVKRAILHILKVVKQPASLSVLYSMLEEKQLPAELRAEIDIAIENIGLVAA